MAANLRIGGKVLIEKAGPNATLSNISLDFGEMLTWAQEMKSTYWRKLSVVQLLLHSRTSNRHVEKPIGGVFLTSKRTIILKLTKDEY